MKHNKMFYNTFGPTFSHSTVENKSLNVRMKKTEMYNNLNGESILN